MTFANRYTWLDRALHRVAFRTTQSQLMLADLEDRLFRGTTEGVVTGPPVFLSGLPRSGTTLMLELLAGSGVFATHTYRDTPFVLCPLFWHRFSRGFRRDEAPRERAHGDGVLVSPDSPEAFEEMIWKRFWPGHYLPDRILPWTGDERNPDFDQFLSRHMAKIVSIRPGGRYLSKNNANLARVTAPPAGMRGGRFVVPVRDPFQQADSMRRQHLRMSGMQRDDPFVREYMSGIGHHDFGLDLRPIDFGGWVDGAPDASDPEFWLRYWLAAYRTVLGATGDVHLVSFDDLLESPRTGLPRLAAAVGLPGDALDPRADRLRAPTVAEIDVDRFPPDLVDAVRDTWEAARSRARI